MVRPPPCRGRLVVVLVQPDASDVAAEIDDRVIGAGFGITMAGFVVGVVFIGVTSFASVLERQPELALRRALGARRSEVAVVVIVESAVLGVIGGVLGACFGSSTLLLRAFIGGTSTGFSLVMAVLAVGSGLAMGVLGGLGPMIKAVKVEPVRFLRML